MIIRCLALTLFFCANVCLAAPASSTPAPAPTPGQAAPPAIDIQMLADPQSIAQIIAIQQKMPLSANPQELSSTPQAICFRAAIEEYLPEDDSNPKSIYGCIFSDQVIMNAALLRAGLFDKSATGASNELSMGAIRAIKAAEQRNFDGQKLKNAGQNTGDSQNTIDRFAKFNDIETDFYKIVVDPILRDDNDHFIFFAIINNKHFKTNLSYELLRAQYSDIPQMSQIILEVWDHQVSPADKQTFIDCLTALNYETTKSTLTREFYAYMLQYDAAAYLTQFPLVKAMVPLIAKYVPIIQAELKEHGIVAISMP